VSGGASGPHPNLVSKNTTRLSATPHFGYECAAGPGDDLRTIMIDNDVDCAGFMNGGVGIACSFPSGAVGFVDVVGGRIRAPMGITYMSTAGGATGRLRVTGTTIIFGHSGIFSRSERTEVRHVVFRRDRTLFTFGTEPQACLRIEPYLNPGNQQIVEGCTYARTPTYTTFFNGCLNVLSQINRTPMPETDWSNRLCEERIVINGASATTLRFLNNWQERLPNVHYYRGEGTPAGGSVLDFFGNIIGSIWRLSLNGLTMTCPYIAFGNGALSGGVGPLGTNPGAIYINLAGGAGTTFYVKESGFGTTSGYVGK
jgi:hypothetical protein